MTLEIRCKIKNAYRTSSYKDVIHYDCNPLDDYDPVIKPFIDDCVKAFGDDPEKVSYSLHKVIQ
jgi:hypothetical protein